MLPWSTRRNPIRPVIGAVICVYANWTLAAAMLAWSLCTAPTDWPDQRLLIVEVLRRDHSLLV